MNKEEFLVQLREALRGNVSQAIINDNVAFYENYILQELRKNRTEEEIMRELGNPRILAQTIIDTAGLESQKKYSEFEEDEEVSTRRKVNSQRVYSGRKAKLILIAVLLILILIIVGLFVLAAKLFKIFAPFLIPLIIILLIIQLFYNRR